MARNAYPLGTAIVIGLGSFCALAQDTTPEPPRDQPPTLDELLGLDDPADSTDTTPAEGTPDVLSPEQSELDKQLSPEQMGEQLDQAAGLMNEIATRMRLAGDVGIATQRQQEDVVRMLEQVISAAEQNQQQQQYKPGQSSSQSQQQQQQPNQPQPKPGAAPEPGEKSAQDTHMPAGASGVQMNPGQAAAGAAWGALPERLREALTQGLSDRYSSLYEGATESYYRRLAEEESP